MRKYILFAIFLILWQGVSAQASERYAASSRLAAGQWVKIRVDDTGIYQLTYDQLREYGFSDPSRVAVFGYGGAMLSEDFSQPYVDDLPQVPVLHTGSKLLFYAQGVLSWNVSNNRFVRTRNPYSMYGYYFLTQLAEAPASPEVVASAAASEAQLTVSTFHDRVLHEQELASPGRMGRNFYGEDFLYQSWREFSFDLPGITSTPVTAEVVFLAKSTSSASTVSVQINGGEIKDASISPILDSDGQNYKCGVEAKIETSFVRNDADPDVVRILFDGNGASAAYLDYILLNMERELRLYDGYVAFRHRSSATSRLRYEIGDGGVSSPCVWDVTTGYAPQEIAAEHAGGVISFVPRQTGLREYVVFDPVATFPSPSWVGTVSNQNLHALAATDFVIVAPPLFRDEAVRLGEFHLAQDSLTYQVVQPAHIYNEFSSGTPDATAIRRFMKMFYDRAAGDESQRPRYLLLLGDGSYDNRRVTQEWASYDRSGYLLTFQSDESIDERNNYVTDDYFGFLHDDEGADLSRATLDLGIGRFPVRTKAEASAMVDKLIAYATNTDYGYWKNDICLVADDGNSGTHMSQSEDLAEILETKNPEFLVHKLYIDAYNRVSAATGATYPDAKEQMLNLLKRDGLLVINYVGHGSTKGWTAEKILEWSDISNMYVSRLPLWITATCDFSRFDDRPNSGGEELFLNTQGGGIALISTTRVVYIHANGYINKAIVEHLFDRDDDGRVVRLGDVVRRGKNSVASNANDVLMNKLNYILLGDPALRLNAPSYKMEVTAINDTLLSEVEADSLLLRARSWVTVKGEVRSADDQKLPDFDGLVYPRLYDSEREVVTGGNGNDNGEVTPYTFFTRDNMLYTGRDSVRGGEFEFTFKMPKELNYSNEPGLFNLYACDSRGRQAQGMNSHFMVGGMDNDTEADDEGPTIHSMYLNTSDFEEGDKVNETPLFVARVEDPSGINISGIGLGHDMTLCVDDDPAQEYVINSYFQPEAGAFGLGDVYYELPMLADGKHSLRFTVWDTEGNSSSRTLQFAVQKGLKPQIYSLYPEKSPVSDVARFYLRHDRPDMLMTIKLSIFDWSGREVWSTEQTAMSTMWVSSPIEWNLTDKAGRRVRDGIYLYRAIISVNGSSEATKTQKIIVTPQ